MLLKRLEIHGFKTFADRTELEFNPGVTAIVGPNGSGKSNIFDAIRWALGETSHRMLRSSRMEDVIFAGSERRKAMGMAQVLLTIDNADEVLPVEFTEVTVGRRANRAGEGGYSLNGVPCRLRDVQMLFLGTGLGGRSYALISQGEVDAILNAAPDERRVLLEEAAGLARYKRRRLEAERKLGHAAAHLLRVTDLIGELEAQQVSLAEQAELAGRFRAHTQELREVELGLRVEEGRRLATLLRRQQTQHESAERRRAESAQAAGDLAAQLEQARYRSVEAARAYEAAQRSLIQVVDDLRTGEAAIRIAEERLRANDENRARVRAELDRAGAEAADEDRELARLRDLVRDLEAQRAGHDAAGRDLDAALAALDGDLRAVRGRLDARRAEAADLAAARARTGSEIAALDARWAGARSRIEALRAQGERLDDAASAAAARRSALEARLDETRRALAGLRGRIEATRASQQKIQEALQAAAAAEQEAALARQAVRARLQVLEEAQAQMAGYDHGAREVLLAKRTHPHRFAGVRGALVDALRVAREHRAAIEAVLDRRLFGLVVDGVDDAKEALRYLREEGSTGAAFLPADLVRSLDGFALPESDAIVGRASALIGADDGAGPVAAALLADALVVTGLDAAVRLHRGGYPGRVVTLDGDVVFPDGAIIGGGRPAESGPLGRGQEIEGARADAARHDERVAALAGERAALHRDLAQVEAALRGLDEERVRTQTLLAELEREFAVLDQEAGRLPRERDAVVAELTALEGDLAALGEQAARLRADLAALGDAGAEVDAAIAALAEEARAAEPRRDDLVGRANAVRIRLAETAGAIDAASARLAEREAEARRRRERVGRLEGELLTLDGERHLLDTGLEETRGRVRALATLQETTNRQLADLDQERAALAEAIERLGREHEQALAAVREHEEALHRIEVRRAQAEAELGAARRRIAEEFGLEWEAAHERVPPGLDRDELLGRAESLRALIAALGAVNMKAIDEHAAVTARLESLRRHADDLRRADLALRSLIEHLDHVLARSFMETFHAVDREFGHLFTRMFGGGRAQLQLTQEEEGRDPGVEVVAQLPGKAVRTLSALSGGERVLVALALVFAMLKVHPSPFCVFDEVEAALDDANTRRFTELLRELARDTQILIITHNKGTMEACDVLYGVTMQEPGVSRLVSMRLVEPEPQPQLQR